MIEKIEEKTLWAVDYPKETQFITLYKDLLVLAAVDQDDNVYTIDVYGNKKDKIGSAKNTIIAKEIIGEKFEECEILYDIEGYYYMYQEDGAVLIDFKDFENDHELNKKIRSGKIKRTGYKFKYGQ